jgi:uncharacterized protein (TIGR00661 family)
VCGDGLGHAVRSAVVADYLESRGHTLQFVCPKGSAYDYLHARWPGRVVPIVGFKTSLDGNRIHALRSLLENLATHTMAPFAHLGAALSIAWPNVVITDFDPWSARYAELVGAPLIAIDNIHFLTKCDHAIYRNRILSERDQEAASVMFPVVDAAVPKARRYLITSFAIEPVTDVRATVHLPIIRPKVLTARRGWNDHIVAYFNDRSDRVRTINMLAATGRPIRAYGILPRGSEPAQVGEVTLCPFSEERLIADLATCHAAVGGAGFTFMTEAIYLGKPVLAVPFGGQFEQICNADYLEAMGYGERCDELTADALGDFLANAHLYAGHLRGLSHDVNRELFSAVDEALLS